MAGLPSFAVRFVIVPAFLAMLCASMYGQSDTSSRQLRIEWLGHECFLFTSSIGLKVLVNPYSPGTEGRALPSKLTTDVILITTEEAAFNHDAAAENSPNVFRGAIAGGLINASGLRIRGVPTAGDSASGRDLVFAWTMDGIRICFAGNPRRALTSEEAALIGRVDVLFLPVGLPGGLSDADLHLMIRQLQPVVIVPMGAPAAIQNWAASSSKSHPLNGDVVFLRQGRLPPEPTVLVFGAP